MNQIAYNIMGFALAIAVLVVVHEFGHYWVAKRLGVKVLRFSVGFGRVLWSRRAGPDNTEYALAAIPLGGYVKMLDENEGPVASDELHRAFNRQPVWKRSAVVAAGPGFNFLFAFFAYWVVLMLGVPGLTPIVGKVVPGSIAAQAGFQRGDRILQLDGRKVRSWDEHRLLLLEKAVLHDRVPVVVRDPDGKTRNLWLDLRHVSSRAISNGTFSEAIGLYGYLPRIRPVLGQVLPHGPAAHAGLLAGDRILTVDGKPIRRWQDLVAVVNASPGRTLQMTVLRGGARQTIAVTPARETVGGRIVGKIDAAVAVPKLPPGMIHKVRLGPVAALRGAWENTWAMSALTVQMLYKMAELRVSTKNISGPLTIAQYAGYSVRVGLGSFLTFLAVVSVSLGVLNLMPVPVLDGGHLLFYLLEVIRGGPVSEKVVGWGQRVGIMLLLGLMVLAFYNDFVRILQ